MFEPCALTTAAIPAQGKFSLLLVDFLVCVSSFIFFLLHFLSFDHRCGIFFYFDIFFSSFSLYYLLVIWFLMDNNSILYKSNAIFRFITLCGNRFFFKSKRFFPPNFYVFGLDYFFYISIKKLLNYLTYGLGRTTPFVVFVLYLKYF